MLLFLQEREERFFILLKESSTIMQRGLIKYGCRNKRNEPKVLLRNVKRYGIDELFNMHALHVIESYF